MPIDAPAFLFDEAALLKECARIGPTGIGVLNRGRANFATTYSTEFCELVADLLLLYKANGIGNSTLRLSEKFRDMKLCSCRGAEMSCQRVEYMLNSCVSKLEKVSTYRVLDRLTKSERPICGRQAGGLEQHMRDAHPSPKHHR